MSMENYISIEEIEPDLFRVESRDAEGEGGYIVALLVKGLREAIKIGQAEPNEYGLSFDFLEYDHPEKGD